MKKTKVNKILKTLGFMYNDKILREILCDNIINIIEKNKKMGILNDIIIGKITAKIECGIWFDFEINTYDKYKNNSDIILSMSSFIHFNSIFNYDGDKYIKKFINIVQSFENKLNKFILSKNIEVVGYENAYNKYSIYNRKYPNIKNDPYEYHKRYNNIKKKEIMMVIKMGKYYLKKPYEDGELSIEMVFKINRKNIRSNYNRKMIMKLLSFAGFIYKNTIMPLQNIINNINDKYIQVSSSYECIKQKFLNTFMVINKINNINERNENKLEKYINTEKIKYSIPLYEKIPNIIFLNIIKKSCESMKL